MTYTLTRTSMSLDQSTLLSLGELSKKWAISKAEVMRRAIKKMKDEHDEQQRIPKPLDALDWLQRGGGLSEREAIILREEVAAERQAKRYWWEE